MKKLIVVLMLLFSLMANTALAGGTLTAADVSVKKMYGKIQQDLRIPAKVLDLCEGAQPEVHFTLDSLGYIQVLSVDTDSPFLEKQLKRSFERIRHYGAEELAGQRFSLQLNLNR